MIDINYLSGDLNVTFDFNFEFSSKDEMEWYNLYVSSDKNCNMMDVISSFTSFLREIHQLVIVSSYNNPLTFEYRFPIDDDRGDLEVSQEYFYRLAENEYRASELFVRDLLLPNLGYSLYLQSGRLNESNPLSEGLNAGREIINFLSLSDETKLPSTVSEGRAISVNEWAKGNRPELYL